MTGAARKLRRLKAKGEMKMLNIKKRVIPAALSDRKTAIVVIAPSMEQFSEYIESISIVRKIGYAFQAIEDSDKGGASIPTVKLDKLMLEAFYPLLAVLSHVFTVEDVNRICQLRLDDLPEIDGDLLRQISGATDHFKELPPITVDEYKELDTANGMAIMFAYVKLLAPDTITNPTPAGEAAPQPETVEPPTSVTPIST